MTSVLGDAPRRRGRPSRINLQAIVEVARTIDPAALTMQAVAERLDVDPKAINYYVGDREGLLALTAFEIFNEELSKAPPPEGDDWRDVVRNYARALRHASAQLGPLARSIRLREAASRSSLELVESVLAAIAAAGFEPGDARRILVAISDIAFADVIDIDLVAQHKTHPQVPDLLQAIEGAGQSFPHLREVVSVAQQSPHDDRQFDFHLESFLSGLDRRR
jgi:TetR/AcrR family transcriptional regulator, tetracycline repressor protein